MQAPQRGGERRDVAGGDDEPGALVADEPAGGGADGVGGDDGECWFMASLATSPHGSRKRAWGATV